MQYLFKVMSFHFCKKWYLRHNHIPFPRFYSFCRPSIWFLIICLSVGEFSGAFNNLHPEITLSSHDPLQWLSGRAGRRDLVQPLVNASRCRVSDAIRQDATACRIKSVPMSNDRDDRAWVENIFIASHFSSASSWWRSARVRVAALGRSVLL